MLKKELRQLYKTRRAQIPESERLKMDDLLLIQFQALAFNHVKNLLSFWPLASQKEINTHILVDYLFFRIPDLQVCFPVLDADNSSFKAMAVDGDTDFKLNAYGIAEPVNGTEMPAEELDLVFLPLLCFDTRGYRVGYGKGYYDKFLPGCRPDLIKAGLCYFDAEPLIEDIDEFDVPLNLCITPNMIYEF